MSTVKIIPFSGVRENGKNMYAVEVDNDIFVLDCGLKYPENELLGIDVVILVRQLLVSSGRHIQFQILWGLV